MRTACIGELFMVGGRTVQNCRFILAGLASDQIENNGIARLGACIATLSFPEQCGPHRLDMMLAEAVLPLKGVAPIVGCTIEVPGIAGLSGGILGSTEKEPCSAAGESEQLPDGWSLLTFPGSPGIACDSNLNDAPDWVLEMCTSDKPNADTIYGLSSYSHHVRATRCIAITDGSGPEASGAALIRKGGRIILWRLDEM